MPALQAVLLGVTVLLLLAPCRCPAQTRFIGTRRGGGGASAEEESEGRVARALEAARVS